MPTAAAGAAEGTETQPWARERSCCAGENGARPYLSFQWKMVIVAMVA